jgi:hypothetical protein
MKYYVDGTVSAGGNGTSWSSAWNSFSAINWSLIKPGDTISISGGTTGETYAGPLTVGANGSATAQVTIAAATDAGHNGPVTIEGNGTLADGVVINGRNYVTVSGLNVRDIADAGFSVKSTSAGVIINGNSVYSGDPGGGNARGYDVRNSTGVLVSGNSFATPTNTAAQTDGIYSQGNNNVTFEHNHIVISNSNTNGHSDDIQSYQDGNVVVRDNWFQQANTATVNNHGAWISDGQTGGAVQFYNNVVLVPNLTSDSAVTDYKETSWSGTGSVNFWNNTIIGGGRGVNIAGANLAQIKNNIIEPAARGYGVVLLPGTSLPTNAVSHNLIWAPNASIANVNNSSLSWAQWQALGYDAGGVNANPDFVNAAGGNYALASGSPAIDHGMTLSPVTTDYNGVARPQGAAYDIGAFEYNSGTSTTTTTSSSGGTSSTSTSSAGTSGTTVSADTLTLALAERPFHGDAEFVVKLDGTTLNGPTPVSAHQNLGQTETFTFTGQWGGGEHDVEVDFVNPRGYSPTHERALYVDQVGYDGNHYLSQPIALYASTGTHIMVGG